MTELGTRSAIYQALDDTPYTYDYHQRAALINAITVRLNTLNGRAKNPRRTLQRATKHIQALRARIENNGRDSQIAQA